MKDIYFGIIGGVVGAAIWAGVVYVTEYEVGWIAWGVGALVGYCVAFGNRDLRRSATAAGVIAVAITALSIAAGKYAAVQLMMPSDQEIVEMFTQAFDDEEYVISYVADGVVGEYLAEGRSLEWPAGVDPGNASSEADYPADVWTEASRRWNAMSESERARFREEKEAESRANIEENLPEIRALLSSGGFFASFTPIDLLFFGLGMVTAWGIASGRKPQEEIESAYSGAVLLAMLKVTAADGVIDDTEIESIRSVFKEVFGAEVDAATIRAEAESVQGDASDLLTALRDLSPHLETAQRETVVRSAVQVALADGEVGPDERRLIGEVAKAVEVSDDQLRGILRNVASNS